MNGIFIDDSASIEVERLEKLYEYTWGHPVEYVKMYMPPGTTLERLAKTLELMCETGDSVIVAYNKLYNKNSKEYILHNKIAEQSTF